MTKGILKNKIVKGIGRIIAISILCCQKFIIKGLLDTICVYKVNKKEGMID